jgi:CRISPR-associated protein Cmr6
MAGSMDEAMRKAGFTSSASSGPEKSAPASKPRKQAQDRKGGGRPGEKHKDGGRKEEIIPMRYLPLYCELRETRATREKEPAANTGLLFEKFVDVWSSPPKCTPDKPAKGEKVVKQRFHDEIAEHFNNHAGIKDRLDAFHVRRGALLDGLDGKHMDFTTDWRFVSGLGMAHVLETGFVWHRVLGVPYLPGSSVKGMVRAWAEQYADIRDDAKRLFGPAPESADNDRDTGSLIVFDAIPFGKPTLEVDIMNPHYGKYYGEKVENGMPKNPPADYLSPVPVFFLTVAKGAKFRFALALRPGLEGCSKHKDDLQLGFKLLAEALASIGAGAKTAVGYGYFNPALEA